MAATDLPSSLARRHDEAERTAATPAQAKREQVIEAGARLFLEQGYGAASMDEVARRAQVSKATIYSYFASKQALFEAIIGQRCASMIPSNIAIDLAEHTPTAALTLIGRRFLALLLSSTALPLYRVVLAESPRFPELGEGFYRNGPSRVAASLAAYLEAQHTKGTLDVPDARLAAEQFFGMILGQMHLRMLLNVTGPPSEDEREKAVATAVGVFVKGYTPPRLYRGDP